MQAAPFAGGLLQEGMGIRQVARLVGASPASVLRWKKALEEGRKEVSGNNFLSCSRP